MVLYTPGLAVPTIRVFVGLSLIGSGKASFALTFQNEDDSKSISFPPEVIEYSSSSNQGKLSDYDCAIVYVIKYALDIVSKSKKKKDLVNVIMYANSDLAAYVWKNEINHAETIDENHMDQADLWIAINKIIKRNSINLCVIGEQSMFNSINHSENKRAVHE